MAIKEPAPPLKKLVPEEVFAELKREQQKRRELGQVSWLVVGESGSGKTTLLKTAVRPIFIDSFDPGGTNSIRHELEGDDILVDTQWESPGEDLHAAWEHFRRTFRHRVRSGVFDKIGTYCWDSLSSGAGVLFGWGTKEAEKEPKYDSRTFYGKAQVQLMIHLREVLSLPCDVIVIAHPDNPDKDSSTTRGISGIAPIFIGRQKQPMMLFSEIYYLEKLTPQKD
ncbi:hypothetical protein LCGC14_1532560 [marine sediment metagenome]|uniref:Uncharacterized protein n=1 Tax=marine sediment metagenome TaxID=412755 RepID=A0A0F9LBD5_9ZZZZ